MSAAARSRVCRPIAMGFPPTGGLWIMIAPMYTPCTPRSRPGLGSLPPRGALGRLLRLLHLWDKRAARHGLLGIPRPIRLPGAPAVGTVGAGLRRPVDLNAPWLRRRPMH